MYWSERIFDESFTENFFAERWYADGKSFFKIFSEDFFDKGIGPHLPFRYIRNRRRPGRLWPGRWPRSRTVRCRLRLLLEYLRWYRLHCLLAYADDSLHSLVAETNVRLINTQEKKNVFLAQRN